MNTFSHQESPLYCDRQEDAGTGMLGRNAFFGKEVLMMEHMLDTCREVEGHDGSMDNNVA